jgi:hypothetical protein
MLHTNMVLALPLLEPQVLEMIRRRALQKKHSVVIASKALIQAAFDAMCDPRYLVPLYVHRVRLLQLPFDVMQSGAVCAELKP